MGIGLLVTMKGNQATSHVRWLDDKQTNVLRTITTVVIRGFPDNKDRDSS
jgi:hypothetical protein